MSAAQRVLGFDFGNKCIGVAIGTAITGSATPLGVVVNGPGGPDWARLDSLLREWQPDALVVGLPLTVEGQEQPASRGARGFAGSLEQRYKLPVHLADERYSSNEASRRFAAARKAGAARARDAASIDAVAAQVIVERFLSGPSA